MVTKGKRNEAERSRAARLSVAEREAAARRAKQPDEQAILRVRADDRELLVHLYRWARWLTLEQAQRLAYPDLAERYVFTRLTHMREAGIVRAMRRPPTRPEETQVKGGAQLIWSVGKWGIWLVEREVLTESRHRTERDFSLSVMYLEHQLRCNDLAIETLVEARAAGAEVEWQAGRDAWIRAGKSRLIPDGIAEFWEGVGRMPTLYFLEMDQGTATLKQLEAKLLRYRHMLAHAEAHQEGQGTEAERWRALAHGRILWICESRERGQRVLDLAAHLKVPEILVRTLEEGKETLRELARACALRAGGGERT